MKKISKYEFGLIADALIDTNRCALNLWQYQTDSWFLRLYMAAEMRFCSTAD